MNSSLASLEPAPGNQTTAKAPRASLPPSTPYSHLRPTLSTKRPTPALKTIDKRNIDPGYKSNVFSVDDETPKSKKEIAEVSICKFTLLKLIFLVGEDSSTFEQGYCKGMSFGR